MSKSHFFSAGPDRLRLAPGVLRKDDDSQSHACSLGRPSTAAHSVGEWRHDDQHTTTIYGSGVEMGQNSGVSERTHGQIEIIASAEQVMSVIADLPNYAAWSEGIEAAEVLTTQDGRPKTARLTFASGPLADVFELEYAWHGVDSVDWHMIKSGEVLKRQDGTYTIVAAGSGTVTVSYDLEVELSIPIIGKLKQRAEKLIIKAALNGLKQRVESLNETVTAPEAQPEPEHN